MKKTYKAEYFNGKGEIVGNVEFESSNLRGAMMTATKKGFGLVPQKINVYCGNTLIARKAPNSAGMFFEWVMFV